MKKLLLIFIASFQLLHAQPLTSDSTSADSAEIIDVIEKLYFYPDSMLTHARQYINMPYKFGGISPETGFDCSGFVCYNFKRYNVELPHSSSEQIKKGDVVLKTETQPGDLIFFKGSDVNSTQAGHVGIVVSRNDTTVKFIHAAIKGGIRFDSTSSDYYRKRYLGIRRVALAKSRD